jgi:pimeloyl-ACP methyl ester carboxylesterase
VSNQNLEIASQLIRSGRVEQARPLLELAIKEDFHNIQAWKLYADTCTNAKDKIRIWEFCLKHNPANPLAQKALASLTSTQKPLRDMQPKAEPVRTPTPVRSEIKGSSQALLWASVAAFLVLVSLAVYVVMISRPKDPAEYRHTRPVEYYLYVPKTYTADKEWPLFVGVHGAGGTGLDCWNLWQQHAEKEGFILLCPSIPGDASGFYQDVGENTVWNAIGEVKRDYRVKQQMFFSGFSAGAFFIQGFAYHYPQYVSGLSILSAGVYLNPGMFINLVPMLVVIGDRDHPDAVQGSSNFVSTLQQFGFSVQYVVLPGVGHVVTDTGIDLTIELFRMTAGK